MRTDASNKKTLNWMSTVCNLTMNRSEQLFFFNCFFSTFVKKKIIFVTCVSNILLSKDYKLQYCSKVLFYCIHTGNTQMHANRYILLINPKQLQNSLQEYDS